MKAVDFLLKQNASAISFMARLAQNFLSEALHRCRLTYAFSLADEDAWKSFMN